jgi:hypothetical protein
LLLADIGFNSIRIKNQKEEYVMQRSQLSIASGLICSAAILLSLPFAARGVSAQTVLSSQQAAQAVSIENLAVSRERITGSIINNTPHRIRDVQLAIQYHWLWRNERNPGSDQPGRTVFIRFNEALEPGTSHRFVYTPDFDLPSRDDGYFMPEVDVAGFAAVIQQTTAAN